MAMHVIGAVCPRCRKKGLVAGSMASGLKHIETFRPAGWRLDSLAIQSVACPHCGVITTALLPRAMRKLKESLKAERLSEKVIYHSVRSRRREKKDQA